MSEALLSFDAIGRQTGTDKASSGHDYLEFYERFFGKLRHEPIRILEVGVLRGASLKLWEQYFPNATIIGADIEPSTARFASQRIKMKIIDQSNVQDLTDLGVEHGPFDIIIEDGSHLWEHQITTLKTLFPFLRNRGYYVVEDLQTNYGGFVPHYRGNASTSCVEYLKALLDLRVSHGQTDISKQEDAFLRTYGRSVGFLVFTQHACLLEKHIPAPPSPPTFAKQPLVATPDAAPSPVALMAHVGHFGDLTDEGSGFISVDPSDRNYIQGFMLTAPEALSHQIRYRARLSDGAWSSWARPNTYVGTRALQTDLTGLSVEITGALRETHDLVVVGAFSGTELVTVGSGEDCVSRTTSFLRGIQLTFKTRTAPVTTPLPGAAYPEPESVRSLRLLALKDVARPG